MNKKGRMLLTVVVLALILTIIVGLGQGKVLAAETRTIVDPMGKSVDIPKDAKRVVVLLVPHPSIFYAVDGSADRLIGMHPSSMRATKNGILGVMAPKILNTATKFVKGGFEVNVEELLKLKPDVVFQWEWMGKEIEKMEAVGIPVIKIWHSEIYSPSEGPIGMLNGWIKTFGEVLGKEERASKFIAYNYEMLGRISSRVTEVPKENKPRVMHISSIKPLNVVGKGDMHTDRLYNLTGAINAVDIKLGWDEPVNMEQVYQWNPDIIYIGNFCEAQPEDLLENKIEGQDWSVVKAVKNGQVYKCPLGIYRWDVLSTDTPLMLLWTAKKNHPELFTNWDLKKEMKKYYLRFYNYNLSDEEVEMILHSKGTKKWGSW